VPDDRHRSDECRVETGPRRRRETVKSVLAHFRSQVIGKVSEDPVERPRVAVQASDPITLAGLVSVLKPRCQVLASDESPADANVLVFAAERVTTDVLSNLRALERQVGVPTVLVTNELDRAAVVTAVVECKVVAVLPRSAATGARLLDCVAAAANGSAVMAPDLLGELLKQVDRMHRDLLAPRGLTASALSNREVDVLRLLADGWETTEIAEKLCYSERTIKNVVHGVTSRLTLRNRPHAVAYAVRSGII
jgi:DNA-binding NarL/FixJ family response regulator